VGIRIGRQHRPCRHGDGGRTCRQIETIPVSVDLQRNRVLDGSDDDRLDVKVYPGVDPDPTTGRMGQDAYNRMSHGSEQPDRLLRPAGGHVLGNQFSRVTPLAMEGVPTDQGSPLPSSSTIPGEPPENWSRWERRFHAASVVLVAAIVLLAAVGLLGVRTGTVVSSGNGYVLEVRHTEISRPGLATPWSAEVSTTDGSALPETITVGLTASYLTMFDFNGLSPTPSSSFSTEGWTWWSFEVPPGQSSLRIDLDVRLEPAVQWVRSGSVALEIEAERLLSVDFATWVMP
jgi:hypothetical protein